MNYSLNDSRSAVECFQAGDGAFSYEYFGARGAERNGERGVLFRVWAPNARSVSVVGSFNDWNKTENFMNRNRDGIWELFIEGVEQGDSYKFCVETPWFEKMMKSDPFAFYAENRPDNASRVYDLSAYEWGDGAPMPKQTNKMYLRQGGRPGLAWCVSDVSDYCADVLVGRFGGVTEDDVTETVNDLRDNNPIIGIEEEKEPVEARIPVRQYMSKMVVPGYVILGSTPYMTIPVMTPPLSDTMDAARILCEVLAVNDSCETDDLYVYQVRFCREYIAKEVAADVFRSWLFSTDVEEQNFLFQSELIDGDFLSDLMHGVLPSITSKGRGFFGMGVKKPAVVNALRAVLVDMKDAYDLVQDIPDSYNKTTYLKWQADVDSLYSE